MRLRVGVYNILGGGKKSGLPGLLADPLRLERLFTKIQGLHCDLLGLVEVGCDYPGNGPTVSDLFALKAPELGYDHNGFGATLCREGIVGSPTPTPPPTPPATERKVDRGNMLLSRYPIVRYHSFLISDFIPYGGNRNTEPRHLLLARVTLPGGHPLYVGVTHLHTITDRNNPCAADVRKVQCERILAIVNNLPESKTTPLLLVGDFNNNPNLARAYDREPEI
jgi:endonuclease/exonuclease/phosphatase family metal-dependent hydrolase